jgi:hypothetical protein
MAETTAGLRIGEILQALGLVSDRQLKEAVRLAGEVALPLGRAVVLYGFLSQRELDMALEIQALVKNKGLPIDTGVRAFKLATRDKVDLGAALESVGYTGSTISMSASRLGTMLLDSGLVTQPQLEVAQRASYETGQPIGKMLVSMGVMSQTQVDVALELQKNFREERITYSQALTKLTPAPEVKSAVQMITSTADKIPRKQIRLGELLLLSGLITDSDIMNALEYGLTKADQPFGKSLMELGLLTQSLLDLALNLQELICEGTVALNSACDTLYSYSITRKAETEQGFTPEPAPKLGELLKIAGIVTDAEINQAIELSARYPSVIGKMLVISGSISEATLLAALRCQFLLKRGLITVDQAVEALRHAETHKMSLDDSLEEIGAPSNF